MACSDPGGEKAVLDVLLCGALGRMGGAVASAVASRDDMRVVAGVDVNASSAPAQPFPVFDSLSGFPGKAGVVIDFSHHTSAPALCEYAVKTSTPLVIATTGHTGEETEAIRNAASSVAVFYSRNMSIGVNLLIRLVKEAASSLGSSFDVEIVEKHHNKKVDAPSGTALMLAEAAASALPQEVGFVYSRKEKHTARTVNEIGIHSVRGGTIVGDHDVIFAGKDEVLTLSHSAYSRDVFAQGAVRAAAFLAGRPAGMYSMDDLLSSI